MIWHFHVSLLSFETTLLSHCPSKIVLPAVLQIYQLCYHMRGFELTMQFFQNIPPLGTYMAYFVISFTSLVNVSISERSCLTNLAKKVVLIHAMQYFFNPYIDTFFRAVSTHLYIIYLFACLHSVFCNYIINSRNSKFLFVFFTIVFYHLKHV